CCALHRGFIDRLRGYNTGFYRIAGGNRSGLAAHIQRQTLPWRQVIRGGKAIDRRQLLKIELVAPGNGIEGFIPGNNMVKDFLRRRLRPLCHWRWWRRLTADEKSNQQKSQPQGLTDLQSLLRPLHRYNNRFRCRARWSPANSSASTSTSPTSIKPRHSSTRGEPTAAP